MNGGLAAGGTVQGGNPNPFMTLGQINAANTKHYGFLIRLQSNHLDAANRFSNARFWLNTKPYDDTIVPPTRTTSARSF